MDHPHQHNRRGSVPVPGELIEYRLAGLSSEQIRGKCPVVIEHDHDNPILNRGYCGPTDPRLGPSWHGSVSCFMDNQPMMRDPNHPGLLELPACAIYPPQWTGEIKQILQAICKHCSKSLLETGTWDQSLDIRMDLCPWVPLAPLLSVESLLALEKNFRPWTTSEPLPDPSILNVPYQTNSVPKTLKEMKDEAISVFGPVPAMDPPYWYEPDMKTARQKYLYSIQRPSLEFLRKQLRALLSQMRALRVSAAKGLPPEYEKYKKMVNETTGPELLALPNDASKIGIFVKKKKRDATGILSKIHLININEWMILERLEHTHRNLEELDRWGSSIFLNILHVYNYCEAREFSLNEMIAASVRRAEYPVSVPASSGDLEIASEEKRRRALLETELISVQKRKASYASVLQEARNVTQDRIQQCMQAARHEYHLIQKVNDENAERKREKRAERKMARDMFEKPEPEVVVVSDETLRIERLSQAADSCHGKEIVELKQVMNGQTPYWIRPNTEALESDIFSDAPSAPPEGRPVPYKSFEPESCSIAKTRRTKIENKLKRLPVADRLSRVNALLAKAWDLDHGGKKKRKDEVQMEDSAKEELEFFRDESVTETWRGGMGREELETLKEMLGIGNGHSRQLCCARSLGGCGATQHDMHFSAEEAAGTRTGCKIQGTLDDSVNLAYAQPGGPFESVNEDLCVQLNTMRRWRVNTLEPRDEGMKPKKVKPTKGKKRKHDDDESSTESSSLFGSVSAPLMTPSLTPDASSLPAIPRSVVTAPFRELSLTEERHNRSGHEEESTDMVTAMRTSLESIKVEKTEESFSPPSAVPITSPAPYQSGEPIQTFRAPRRRKAYSYVVTHAEFIDCTNRMTTAQIEEGKIQYNEEKRTGRRTAAQSSISSTSISKKLWGNVGPTLFRKRTVTFDPIDVKSILRRMDPEFMKLIGCDPESSPPHWKVLINVPLPPPNEFPTSCVRTYNGASTRVGQNHLITRAEIAIAQCDKMWKYIRAYEIRTGTVLTHGDLTREMPSDPAGIAIYRSAVVLQNQLGSSMGPMVAIRDPVTKREDKRLQQEMDAWSVAAAISSKEGKWRRDQLAKSIDFTVRAVLICNVAASLLEIVFGDGLLRQQFQRVPVSKRKLKVLRAFLDDVQRRYIQQQNSLDRILEGFLNRDTLPSGAMDSISDDIGTENVYPTVRTIYHKSGRETCDLRMLNPNIKWSSLIEIGDEIEVSIGIELTNDPEYPWRYSETYRPPPISTTRDGGLEYLRKEDEQDVADAANIIRDIEKGSPTEEEKENDDKPKKRWSKGKNGRQHWAYGLLRKMITLFNRQPSLKQQCITAQRICRGGRTVTKGLAILMTWLSNADFDGDVSTDHIPQMLKARAEATMLMTPDHYFLTQESNSNDLHFFQCTLEFLHYVSKFNWNFTDTEFVSICTRLIDFRDCSSGEEVGKRLWEWRKKNTKAIAWYTRHAETPPENRPWTAQMLLALILPEGAQYTRKEGSVYTRLARPNDCSCAEGTAIHIENGWLLHGQFTKKECGKGELSLIRTLAMRTPSMRMVQFFDDCVSACTAFISFSTFTLNAPDFYISHVDIWQKEDILLECITREREEWMSLAEKQVSERTELERRVGRKLPWTTMVDREPFFQRNQERLESLNLNRTVDSLDVVPPCFAVGRARRSLEQTHLQETEDMVLNQAVRRSSYMQQLYSRVHSECMAGLVGRRLLVGNGLHTQAESGSRGSEKETGESALCIGLPLIDNKLLALSDGGRVFPYADGGLDPKDRGFVSSSYVSGLTLSETIMSGAVAQDRAAVSSGGVKKPGAVMRTVTHLSNNVIIGPDRSVRNHSGKRYASFYGGDSASGKLCTVPTTSELISTAKAVAKKLPQSVSDDVWIKQRIREDKELEEKDEISWPTSHADYRVDEWKEVQKACSDALAQKYTQKYKDLDRITHLDLVNQNVRARIERSPQKFDDLLKKLYDDAQKDLASFVAHVSKHNVLGSEIRLPFDVEAELLLIRNQKDGKTTLDVTDFDVCPHDPVPLGVPSDLDPFVTETLVDGLCETITAHPGNTKEEEIENMICPTKYQENLLAYIRSELNWKRLVSHHRLRLSTLSVLIERLHQRFNESRIAPFSPAGLFMTQAFVPPQTQGTLNTKHEMNKRLSNVTGIPGVINNITLRVTLQDMRLSTPVVFHTKEFAELCGFELMDKEVLKEKAEKFFREIRTDEICIAAGSISGKERATRWKKLVESGWQLLPMQSDLPSFEDAQKYWRPHNVSEFLRIDARKCIERELDIETVLQLVVGSKSGAYHVFAYSNEEKGLIETFATMLFERGTSEEEELEQDLDGDDSYERSILMEQYVESLKPAKKKRKNVESKEDESPAKKKQKPRKSQIPVTVSGAVTNRGKTTLNETEVADVCDISIRASEGKRTNVVGQCTYLYSNDKIHGQFSAETLQSVWQPCGNRNAVYDTTESLLSIQVNDSAHATVGYDYLYRLIAHPHVDSVRCDYWDVRMCQQLMGITAARNILIRKYEGAMSSIEYVSRSHYDLLARLQTCIGTAISIDGSGMTKVEPDTLTSCSYQNTAGVLFGAVRGHVTKLTNIFPRIILGLPLLVGTQSNMFETFTKEQPNKSQEDDTLVDPADAHSLQHGEMSEFLYKNLAYHLGGINVPQSI